MPRLLVLVDGANEETAGIAESIRAGARSVRFAECDLMRLPGAPDAAPLARLRPLDDVEALSAYDAIVVGAPAGEHQGLLRLLSDAGALGLQGGLANKLGAVFPARDASATGEAHPLWPLLAPMARYGMILVPPGYAGPDGAPEDISAAAQRLGKRLVDIAGWITHARSHHHH